VIIAWSWIVPLLFRLDYLAGEGPRASVKHPVPFRVAVYMTTLTAGVSATFILASVIGWAMLDPPR
jgi:hypothetical protein